MKKNNEMVYWIIFIVILMCISLYIILYFRGNRNIDVYEENVNKVENVPIVVE